MIRCRRASLLATAILALTLQSARAYVGRDLEPYLAQLESDLEKPKLALGYAEFELAQLLGELSCHPAPQIIAKLVEENQSVQQFRAVAEQYRTHCKQLIQDGGHDPHNLQMWLRAAARSEERAEEYEAHARKIAREHLINTYRGNVESRQEECAMLARSV